MTLRLTSDVPAVPEPSYILGMPLVIWNLDASWGAGGRRRSCSVSGHVTVGEGTYLAEAAGNPDRIVTYQDATGVLTSVWLSAPEAAEFRGWAILTDASYAPEKLLDEVQFAAISLEFAWFGNAEVVQYHTWRYRPNDFDILARPATYPPYGTELLMLTGEVDRGPIREADDSATYVPGALTEARRAGT